MTCLLRTRGSASEMAGLFDAEPNPRLEWREPIWTGDAVPVVVMGEDGTRRIRTMTWGLPALAFAKAVPAKQRGSIYPRDLTRTGSRVQDPVGLERCLIILESFAYPMGQAGECTRGWIGLWDEPLTVWAGVCIADCCAGLLVLANERVEPLSDTMPRLLQPEDRDLWLAGPSLLSLGPGYPEAAFYRENLGERWSSGQQIDNAQLLFTTSRHARLKSPDQRSARPRGSGRPAVQFIAGH